MASPAQAHVQQKEKAFSPGKTYLAYFLAPFGLRALNMEGIANMIPQFSAAAAGVLHGFEVLPFVGRYMNVGLGVISLVNGLSAYNHAKEASDWFGYAQPALEAWLAYTAGKDAFEYKR